MSEQSLPFFSRLWMAFICFFAILFNRTFAGAVLPTYERRKALSGRGENRFKTADRPEVPERAAPSAPEKPNGTHASALFILSALQREGRFIDFLQENVGAFSDEQVGAAARVVHTGCRKVLAQYFVVEPVMREAEGARVNVPAGFDAERIRLTGNVSGQPPFSGELRHHGWVTRQMNFPELSPALDPRVLAPAEVELS